MRPHIIRHTLNIVRRRAKIDPVARGRLLTHTNFSSLQHYEHALDGELAEAREQQHEGLRAYLGNYLADYVPGLSSPVVGPSPKPLK